MNIVTDNEILKIKSENVDANEVTDLYSNLIHSIPPSGVGLSAPQLGIHKRIFIAHLSSGKYVFVNPTLELNDKKFASTEGCLSLPDVFRTIHRSTHIKVNAEKILKYRVINDQIETTECSSDMELSFYDSAIVQHENDHLDGILITDHVPVSKQSEEVVDNSKNRRERIIKKRQEKQLQSASSIPKTQKKKLSASQLKKKKNQARKQRKRTLLITEIRERYEAQKEGL